MVNEDIKTYSGHPNGSVEEFVALADDSLALFTGEEDMIHEGDELPVCRFVNFT